MQIATYNNMHSYIFFQQVFISQKLWSTPIPQPQNLAVLES
jgi:hypothetical protein